MADVRPPVLGRERGGVLAGALCVCVCVCTGDGAPSSVRNNHITDEGGEQLRSAVTENRTLTLLQYGRRALPHSLRRLAERCSDHATRAP